MSKMRDDKMRERWERRQQVLELRKQAPAEVQIQAQFSEEMYEREQKEEAQALQFRPTPPITKSELVDWPWGGGSDTVAPNYGGISRGASSPKGADDQKEFVRQRLLEAYERTTAMIKNDQARMLKQYLQQQGREDALRDIREKEETGFFRRLAETQEYLTAKQKKEAVEEDRLLVLKYLMEEKERKARREEAEKENQRNEYESEVADYYPRWVEPYRFPRMTLPQAIEALSSKGIDTGHLEFMVRMENVWEIVCRKCFRNHILNVAEPDFNAASIMEIICLQHAACGQPQKQSAPRQVEPVNLKPRRKLEL